MRKTDLIEMLEKVIGVNKDDPNPFSPKVEIVMGSQKTAPRVASGLALCEKGVLIFQPRGTSTYSRTISGKKVVLIQLLRKVTDLFYNKREGKMKYMAAFSDTSLALFNCDQNTVNKVAEELGIRGVDCIIIEKFRLIETVIDKHSSRKGKLPPRKGAKNEQGV